MCLWSLAQNALAVWKVTKKRTQKDVVWISPLWGFFILCYKGQTDWTKRKILTICFIKINIRTQWNRLLPFRTFPLLYVNPPELLINNRYVCQEKTFGSAFDLKRPSIQITSFASFSLLETPFPITVSFLIMISLHPDQLFLHPRKEFYRAGESALIGV